MFFAPLWLGLLNVMGSKFLVALLAIIFSGVWLTVEAADAPGKSAYALCAACHGQQAEGNQAMGSPRLAGQPAWYLKSQLLAYRAGLRGVKPNDAFGAQMRPMAMQLANDAAIDQVVSYIVSLKPTASAATVQGDKSKGQVHYAVCVACHGTKGEGNQTMNSPPLVGQSDWYLVTQLKNFRSGIRGSDPKDVTGMQMAPMAKVLPNDQAILDVVAYIQTLK